MKHFVNDPVFQEYLNRKNSGNGYSIHQPQGNKKYGTEKSGFLLKKSDGWVKTQVLESELQIAGANQHFIIIKWCNSGVRKVFLIKLRLLALNLG